MIPATFQRNHPTECTAVGDYIPANTVPAWHKERTYKFSPEIYELKTGPLPKFDEEVKACLEKYTLWIFEPRPFKIGGNLVTMFVRVQ